MGDEPGTKGDPSEAVPSPPGCDLAASEHGRVLPAKTGSTDGLRQGEGMNWVKP